MRYNKNFPMYKNYKTFILEVVGIIYLIDNNM